MTNQKKLIIFAYLKSPRNRLRTYSMKHDHTTKHNDNK